MAFLAEQIRSRQKAKDKLPTWVDQQALIFPPSLSVEQCSSEVTAKYKAGLVSGSHIVDLTGGMGVDTLAFAEHFAQVTYVEQNPELCERFAYNAAVFGKDVKVHCDTAEAFLVSQTLSAGTVFFIDPARRDENARKVFRFADCTPNVVSLLDFFQEQKATVLVKASPLIDLRQGLKELSHVKEIHVVSVKNDCKEVLFLLDFSREIKGPTIHAINFATEGREVFRFTFEEESHAQISYAPAGRYLLLPNASILKAGAFNSVAKQLNVRKISSNTHLYTADELIINFPGRQFEIIEMPVSKKLERANVISRNYPLSPEQILKKYGLKEGGDYYLIAYRDMHEKSQIVVAMRR